MVRLWCRLVICMGLLVEILSEVVLWCLFLLW